MFLVELTRVDPHWAEWRETDVASVRYASLRRVVAHILPHYERILTSCHSAQSFHQEVQPKCKPFEVHQDCTIKLFEGHEKEEGHAARLKALS